MELREALTQIAEIRLQLARTTVFRGYRALPVAFSGCLALVAAAIQAWWLPEPGRRVPAYLLLWTSVAAVSVLVAGLEMVIRYRRSGSHLSRELTILATEQFVPCVLAGGLLTLAFVVVAPEVVWLLPGLWQLFFALGIFASARLLPRPLFGAALFYLATGLFCVLWARGEHALSPWAMGLPFGVGQLGVAALLYWTLERRHGED